MIDLHTHSTASDGSEPPGRVMELAAAEGCSAVALTDHDGLGGLTAASEAALALGMRFVRGCELSCSFTPGSLHVLCYFVPDDGPLPRRLFQLREEHARRNTLLLERLGELGIEITEDEVRAQAGSAVVGRPHVAAALVRHGVVPSINEAFERFIGKGAPAYVERETVEVEEITKLARLSGAVTAVAHPLSLGLALDELDAPLSRFSQAGVIGLESYYGNYDPALRSELARLARRHGLVPTGGSDFHGSFKPGLRVARGRGDLVVPDEALDELEERRPPQGARAGEAHLP